MVYQESNFNPIYYLKFENHFKANSPVSISTHLLLGEFKYKTNLNTFEQDLLLWELLKYRTLPNSSRALI